MTPHGDPRVSVVAPAIEGDTVWTGTGRSSRKARNLSATLRAALVWGPDAEIYVSADTELIDDLDHNVHVRDRDGDDRAAPEVRTVARAGVTAGEQAV